MTNYKTNIVKIAENNVEIQKILFDVVGNEVIVERESYGADRIASEKEFLLAQKESIQNYNKTNQLKEIDEKLTIIAELEVKIK